MKNSRKKYSNKYFLIRKIIKEELAHQSEEEAKEKMLFGKVFLIILLSLISLLGLIMAITVFVVYSSTSSIKFIEYLMVFAVSVLVFLYYLFTAIQLIKKKAKRIHSQIFYYIFTTLGVFSALYYLFEFLKDIGLI